MSDSSSPGTVPRRGRALDSVILGILSLGCLAVLVGMILGVVPAGGVGELFLVGAFVFAVPSVFLGIAALRRANREPKGVAIAALTVPLVIVLVAAFAMQIHHDLGRHDPMIRNESQTLFEIRTFISAEAAYQSASGGYYGPPECLGRPLDCLPGYTGPNFLDPSQAWATVKYGYRRTFHPGHAPAAGRTGAPAPRGSLTSFAYTAVPVEPGVTGRWSFCGDLSPTTSGRLCQVRSGPIYASGGQCPPHPACAEYEPGR